MVETPVGIGVEQEDKEKTIIDSQKMEGDIKSLRNLLIMNLAIIADYIRQEKGMDSWAGIFNNAKEISDNYKKWEGLLYKIIKSIMNDDHIKKYSKNLKHGPVFFR
jgi:hypothetical protein